MIAELIDADLLVILSDIDGLYSGDPHNNPEAKIISLVSEFFTMAGKTLPQGSASSFGTEEWLPRLWLPVSAGRPEFML
jgi:glutamate 5-kinase